MIKDEYLVSIIMPCYNSAETLEESIESVLAQTYSNFELILVDDGSIDQTLEIINRYLVYDKRVRFFRTKCNSGAAVARNIAIENANGTFIAFLDSDDVWMPEKLEKQILFMVTNDLYFTYSNYYVNKNNKIISYKPRDSVSYNNLLVDNCIGCLTVVYNCKKLGKVFMPLDAPKREDYAAWLSILKNGIKAQKIDEFLGTYRIVSTSVSNKKNQMLKYQWIVYRKFLRLNFFKSLFCLVIYSINKLFFKY